MKVADLARLAHMSVSVFHGHFKAVTSMSPLQYQKALRLQKARHLMLSRQMDALTACQLVGYIRGDSAFKNHPRNWAQYRCDACISQYGKKSTGTDHETSGSEAISRHEGRKRNYPRNVGTDVISKQSACPRVSIILYMRQHLFQLIVSEKQNTALLQEFPLAGASLSIP
ncbi:helix-turn-helix domain-containing protein [Acetonema longum]|uniref:helix-turn-helix domain-containing protein n=1 Tax=Acetonema longum TaxID=2374 RepID=UPI0009079F8F